MIKLYHTYIYIYIPYFSHVSTACRGIISGAPPRWPRSAAATGKSSASHASKRRSGPSPQWRPIPVNIWDIYHHFYDHHWYRCWYIYIYIYHFYYQYICNYIPPLYTKKYILLYTVIF